MTERDDFEARLAQRLQARSHAIDGSYDAVAIARTTAAMAREASMPGPRRSFAPSRWRPRSLGLALLLVATLLAAALVIATGALDHRTPDRRTSLTTTIGGPGVAHMEVQLETLQDGRVLLTGTWRTVSDLMAWNPDTGRFELTGSLATPVRSPWAVPLPDGRVLLLERDVTVPQTQQVLDPVLGTAVLVDPPVPGRLLQAPLWLDDGTVLFGRGNAGQVFDPATGGWSAAGPDAAARRDPAGVRLSDGRILTVGRTGSALWDPATQAVTTTGGTGIGWTPCAALALPDDRVLALGGEGGPDEVAIWDATSGVFQPVGRLGHQVEVCDAALLHDGRILVVAAPRGPQDSDQAQLLDLRGIPAGDP